MRPDFLITVNGAQFDMGQDKAVSYERLVEMATGGGHAGEGLFTVTYRGNGRGGALQPGQSVTLEDGMIFNDVTTSRA